MIKNKQKKEPISLEASGKTLHVFSCNLVSAFPNAVNRTQGPNDFHVIANAEESPVTKGIHSST